MNRRTTRRKPTAATKTKLYASAAGYGKITAHSIKFVRDRGVETIGNWGYADNRTSLVCYDPITGVMRVERIGETVFLEMMDAEAAIGHRPEQGRLFA